MAGAWQGFVVNRNLEENPIDFNAINNLGGGTIAQELSLFRNNVRNVSTLVIGLANIDEVQNKFVFPEISTVFTNGTKVTLNSFTYYIKNSNGENEFQFSDNPNLSTTVTINEQFVGVCARSDEVTKTNLNNFAPRRRSALVQTQDNQNSDVSNFSANVKEQIDSFESNIDNFKNTKDKSLLINSDFTTDVNFVKEGLSTIIDPDGVNNNSLTTTSGPGLFIYNPLTGSKVRAFSDTQNVWEPNIDLVTPANSNTYLQTTAVKITVGALVLNTNPIRLQQKVGAGLDTLLLQGTTASPLTTTGATPVFTHKVRAYINGEEYFLCLSNSATVP